MNFEERAFSAIYGIGEVAGWVPVWLWWALLAMVLLAVMMAFANLGWGAVEVFVDGVDRMNDVVGRSVSWFMAFVVLAAFIMVFVRYVVEIGAVWTNDLIIWPHGIAFMLAAGYTFLNNEHVRVDIFYAKASKRWQAKVDIVGTLLFLFPWLATLAFVATPYAIQSWEIMERSDQTGGLPAVYFVKTAIPFFCLLLGLQGLSLIGRSVLVLAGYKDYGEEPRPDAAHA